MWERADVPLNFQKPRTASLWRRRLRQRRSKQRHWRPVGGRGRFGAAMDWADAAARQHGQEAALRCLQRIPHRRERRPPLHRRRLPVAATRKSVGPRPRATRQAHCTHSPRMHHAPTTHPSRTLRAPSKRSPQPRSLVSYSGERLRLYGGARAPTSGCERPEGLSTEPKHSVEHTGSCVLPPIPDVINTTIHEPYIGVHCFSKMVESRVAQTHHTL